MLGMLKRHEIEILLKAGTRKQKRLVWLECLHDRSVGSLKRIRLWTSTTPQSERGGTLEDSHPALVRF
jgi:hypothetical protein